MYDTNRVYVVATYMMATYMKIALHINRFCFSERRLQAADRMALNITLVRFRVRFGTITKKGDPAIQCIGALFY